MGWSGRGPALAVGQGALRRLRVRESPPFGRCDAQAASAPGLGCAKTKSDLVLMPSGRRIFAFSCSLHDCRAQNSGCGFTAQSFYTARVKTRPPVQHPHVCFRQLRIFSEARSSFPSPAAPARRSRLPAARPSSLMRHRLDWVIEARAGHKTMTITDRPAAFLVPSPVALPMPQHRRAVRVLDLEKPTFFPGKIA